jgi:hypothetical protein
VSEEAYVLYQGNRLRVFGRKRLVIPSEKVWTRRDFIAPNLEIEESYRVLGRTRFLDFATHPQAGSRFASFRSE